MTDIVERLKRVRYTRERGDGPNGTYFEEPCDADDTDAVASLINPDGPEAAAEIERLRAERDEAIREVSRLGRELGTTQARLAEAVEGLKEAREDIDFWSGYASDYFVEKWDLKGTLAKYDALIAKLEGRTLVDTIGSDVFHGDNRDEMAIVGSPKELAP